MQSKQKSTTYNKDELKKFDSSINNWWDAKGPFAALHRMNSIRIDYIKNHIINYQQQYQTNSKQIKILDIGCGGGLVTIALAKTFCNQKHNFHFTALDPNPNCIKALKKKAEQLQLSNITAVQDDITALNFKTTPQNDTQNTIKPKNNDYQETKTKHLKTKYDVILCMEVLEHIDKTQRSLFFKSLTELAQNPSIILISTINKSLISYLQSIIAAEYILKIVPTKTHKWSDFLKPSEIVFAIQNHLEKTKILDISGMSYNPINKKWKICKSIKNNYIMTILNEK